MNICKNDAEQKVNIARQEPGSQDGQILEGEVFTQEELDWIKSDIEQKRNLHDQYNKLPFEEERLKNKIDIRDILDFLPNKVLINTKVYQFTLKYKGPNVWIYFTNRMDDLTEQNLDLSNEKKEEKNDREGIEEVLRPDIPFAFHEEDTAYLVMELLQLLIEVNAVEVTDNLKLNGNYRIHELLEHIMKL